MKPVLFGLTALLLASCSSPSLQGMFDIPASDTTGVDQNDVTPEEEQVEVAMPIAPPAPATNARTVEQFDTTTAQDRAAALDAPQADDIASEQDLGVTLATLGDPTDPGIWIKTPLVNAIVQGRAEYQGASVNLELRPSGGASGSGSQISLPAMRLLNAPLTGILEIHVFSGS